MIARDMAFPRLNAFSFWLTGFGALILYASFFGGNSVLQAGNAHWDHAGLEHPAGHFWKPVIELADGSRPPRENFNFMGILWCARRDSNSRPSGS